MKFSDIPKMTRDGRYRVNMSWDHIFDNLKDWEEEQGLDLDPDFQRSHVWNEEKQRKYVEFIMRGGQSSKVIYFNCSSWQKNYNTPIVLVDGKQRLEAVRKFMDNELEVFGNNKLSDFEGTFPWGRYEFIVCINDLETRAEVLQWYIDINDGGVAHTSEEIQKVKDLLKKENK